MREGREDGETEGCTFSSARSAQNQRAHHCRRSVRRLFLLPHHSIALPSLSIAVFHHCDGCARVGQCRCCALAGSVSTPVGSTQHRRPVAALGRRRQQQPQRPLPRASGRLEWRGATAIDICAPPPLREWGSDRDSQSDADCGLICRRCLFLRSASPPLTPHTQPPCSSNRRTPSANMTIVAQGGGCSATASPTGWTRGSARLSGVHSFARVAVCTDRPICSMLSAFVGSHTFSVVVIVDAAGHDDGDGVPGERSRGEGSVRRRAAQRVQAATHAARAVRPGGDAEARQHTYTTQHSCERALEADMKMCSRHSVTISLFDPDAMRPSPCCRSFRLAIHLTHL